MWKLTIEDDEGNKTPLVLARAEYQVGRDEANSVRLTDRNISRKHASLKKQPTGEWQLVDHDSYNGVFVNGQRVATSSSLSHADLVQIGDYRIFLTNEALGSEDVKSRALGSAELPDRFVVLAGPNPGAELRLDTGPVTIGRSEECTYPMNHPSVSRVHVLVQPLGDSRFEILDKGSANGVRVNGRDLKRGLLEAGDLVELGDVRMRFLGHGQTLRPSVDATQALSVAPDSDRVAPSARDPVVGTRTSTPPPKSAARGGEAMMLAIVIGIVGAGGTGGYLAWRSSQQHVAMAPETTAPAVAPPVDDGRDSLAAARAAAEDGDYAAVWRHLEEIPSGSALRSGSEVTALYGKWADSVFARANQATDPSQKRVLLQSVVDAAGVDTARRSSASRSIASIDAASTPSDALSARPLASATAKRAHHLGAEPLASSPSIATLVTPAGQETDPTHAASHDKTPVKDKGPVSSDGVFRGEEGVASVRQALEARVWSGKGTPDDIRMLRAICRQQGDKVCSDRAAGLLAKSAN